MDDLHDSWNRGSNWPDAFGRRAFLAGAASAVALGPAALAAREAPASAAAADAAVAALRDTIVGISREVWALGEVSLAEVQSYRVHLRALEAGGFRILSTGTAGVPTAFVAEWSQGTGGPVIGYLPEYDALPALGNAAEPRRAPGPTEAGHGCGHNHLGAGCTGAALALKAMMEADGTPGTIRVYGCAAEETEGAKVYMVRAGLFDDVDAAFAWHAAPFSGVAEARLTANAKAKVRFYGTSAHAGNSPWEGRSALKAAELFGAGVQYMREHLQSTARVHYVYESAGSAPNIVPDFAQVWIVARDADRPRVGAMMDWLREIADGAAMMTQTRAEFDEFIGVHNLLPNRTLTDLAFAHMTDDPMQWTEAEQAFARACQAAEGLPERGLFRGALQLGAIQAGASTDVGDISFKCPVGIFGLAAFPQGFGLHTWAVTAAGGMEIGDRAALVAARILAGMGHDFMTDPALRAAAAADFRAVRGDAPYVSPLPPDRVSPLGVPDWLAKTGEDEIFGFDPT
jgi:aminobenzoyl-glutamate utilization protein B